MKSIRIFDAMWWRSHANLNYDDNPKWMDLINFFTDFTYCFFLLTYLWVIIEIIFIFIAYKKKSKIFKTASIIFPIFVCIILLVYFIFGEYFIGVYPNAWNNISG